jgi:spore germination protein
MRPVHLARVLTAFTVAALLAGAGVVAAAPAAAATAPVAAPASVPVFVPVEGYVESGTDAAGLVQHASRAMTTVGIDGLTVHSTGRSLNGTTASMRGAVRAAHARGDRVELLVSNYSSSIQDFSPRLGSRVLRSASNRATVARAVAKQARRGGFDGVQIDFESLRSGDRAGLVKFASAVRRDVHRRLGSAATVSMAVMASTSVDDYRATGYDVPALAKSLDRMVLMTYDQHGPWSKPGTIGSLRWTKAAVAAFVAAGAKRSRTDMGDAGYGYVWPAHGDDTQVTSAQARAKAGSHAVWSDTTGEWSATLDDGTVMHWSDERSLDVRLQLAASLHLHGVAMWSLGDMPMTSVS